MGRLSPPQLVILSFFCVIMLGTIVLSLPMATNGPDRLSVVDSLFTATSATCVTGLVVKDTGAHFSAFGKAVILFLFQIGGLGIMTLSTLFAVMLGRKISFHETDVIKSTLDKQSKINLKKLIVHILAITCIVEGIGATVLFLRWRNIMGWSVLHTIEQSIFHAVSGFCNAGFSLFYNSLMGFAKDPVINVTMILLIFLGGIGFIVIMDILGVVTKRKLVNRLSLHSKLVLLISAILIILGAVLFLFFERDGMMRTMSTGERVWGSLFQSVTARTAGFNTLDIGKMTIPSLMVLILLMFVGASPGSTGGGIKTSTFAILISSGLTMIKGRKRVAFFGRSIPKAVIREAMGIFFLAISWVFIATVLLTYFEGGRTTNSDAFVKSLFEVVSAFGTVGLSTGVTAGLTVAGKVCIIATMFAGRVGPLTLVLAVAFRKKKESYIFPEENVMVG